MLSLLRGRYNFYHPLLIFIVLFTLRHSIPTVCGSVDLCMGYTFCNHRPGLVVEHFHHLSKVPHDLFQPVPPPWITPLSDLNH